MLTRGLLGYTVAALGRSRGWSPSLRAWLAWRSDRIGERKTKVLYIVPAITGSGDAPCHNHIVNAYSIVRGKCASILCLWCGCLATSFPQVHLQRLRPGNLAAFQPSQRGTISTIMEGYTGLFDTLADERRRVDQFYSFWNRR